MNAGAAALSRDAFVNGDGRDELSGEVLRGVIGTFDSLESRRPSKLG